MRAAAGNPKNPVKTAPKVGTEKMKMKKVGTTP
jgi:hypothetical protein